MNSTKMDIDIISDLPEALICHILSFLTTKEAALTSLLSQKWRYLFAYRPNLDFDDSERNEVHRGFMDFVDRVLGLQGNSTIDRFSLKCDRRGVSDLDLRGALVSNHSMPSSVFVSKSLVRLRIETLYDFVIDLAHVFLPKLKTLHLMYVVFEDVDSCLVKLISGCHVLEELVMINLHWDGYWSRSVSSKTLKRLTVRSVAGDAGPYRISFDTTPNLVYFEYDDYVVEKYETMNFDSLVEARIGLLMTSRQIAHASYGDLVFNATNLFMGISNVQVLHLCSDTLEVLTFCCEPIPVFKNLIQLTVTTHEDLGWESLPALLKNCPKLETLVFEGLYHRNTIKCKDADGCLCKSSEVDIRSCLSSSPVKVLKILDFGYLPCYSEENETRKVQVMYFLETMPNLEQMILYHHSLIDEDLKSQLERVVPRGASSKCRIQLINNG
ncbi:PREDICTED: LOW QUALITY PROTEIN: putative F-box/FBD/LRR-repeat protein At3g59240 [Camelina sativa]|uniref:LOW QUALITY PROTEIN: putative F-box/FBD/LRR-repeat protein At3g59240 n=1 Tax=Camelina sativa TaxID=90675 RepID=A0ABM1R3F7_CAMSA|nr:PREDICTED: LOW QUALITY PROTEIN: putative F-box/FBD/LRR-repeat protein At3g59240 [Camelina sativa]